VKHAKFITLTYPDSHAERSYKKRTTDRYLMQRYIEKFLGAPCPVLWRTEWQERKSGERKGELVPHVHMLAFAAPFLPYWEVNRWWKTILGVSGYVRTECRGCNDGEHAAKYVAKYASKLDSVSLVSVPYLNRLAGRSWGVMRPRLIPWGFTHAAEDVPQSTIVALFERASRVYVPLRDGPVRGFSILGPNARKLWEVLDEGLLT
jgi:hypothetical protein